MDTTSIVKVEGNGLNCYAWVECVPNIGPRATAGHVLVRPSRPGHTSDGNQYWVERKNCTVITVADDIHDGQPTCVGKKVIVL